MKKTPPSKEPVIAVIPVKGNSNRVHKKNFRPFFGDNSLLKIKIEQCIKSGVFDEVYVSSDANEAKYIADSFGAKFSFRSDYLCKDETPWGEVLEGILNSIPVKNETLVAWCPVTSPLFNRYKEVVDSLESNTIHDSVVTVTQMNHYFLSAEFIPINLS